MRLFDSKLDQKSNEHRNLCQYMRFLPSRLPQKKSHILAFSCSLKDINIFHSDIAHTNRTIQSYLVDQMNELSTRQADERAQAMREHAADLEKEAKDQQRIRDALKHYGAY